MSTTSPESSRRPWRIVVLDGLRSHDGSVSLATLYGYVEARGAELVAANPHWRDKVRQQVQVLAKRGLAEHVAKGIWKAART